MNVTKSTSSSLVKRLISPGGIGDHGRGFARFDVFLVDRQAHFAERIFLKHDLVGLIFHDAADVLAFVRRGDLDVLILVADGFVWIDDRLEEIAPVEAAKIYPSKSENVNRELSKVLVFLDAPGVVPKTMALLRTATTQESQIQYAFQLRNGKQYASPRSAAEAWTADWRCG